MRTAHIALQFTVDDTQLQGHSKHVKDLADLLNATKLTGTAAFQSIGNAAGLSLTAVRTLGKQLNNLNSAIVDLTTQMQKQQSAVSNVNNTTNQYVGTVNKLSTSIGTVNIKINQGSQHIRRYRSDWQELQWTIVKTSNFFHAIGFFGRQIFGELEASAKRIDLKNTLNAQFEDFEKTIERVKAKTAGLVATDEITKSMALMSSFNLPMETFAEQMELVNKMAIRTGQSTAYMMDSFARGISRLSAPILDNLGIQVVLKDVYADFAISVGKSVDQLSKFEKQAAVTNYVLDEMGKKTEGIELFDTLASSIKGVENRFKEIKNDTADWLTETAVDIIDWYAPIFNSDATNQLNTTKQEISDIAKRMLELKNQGLTLKDKEMQDLKARLESLRAEVEFNTVNADLINKRIDLEKQYNKLVKDHLDVGERFKYIQAEFRAALNTEDFLREMPKTLQRTLDKNLETLLQGVDKNIRGPVGDQIKAAWREHIATVMKFTPELSDLQEYNEFFALVAGNALPVLTQITQEQIKIGEVGKVVQGEFASRQRAIIEGTKEEIRQMNLKAKLESGMVMSQAIMEDQKVVAAELQTELNKLLKEQEKFADGELQANGEKYESLEMQIMAKKRMLIMTNDEIQYHKMRAKEQKDFNEMMLVDQDKFAAFTKSELKAEQLKLLGVKSRMQLEKEFLVIRQDAMSTEITAIQFAMRGMSAFWDMAKQAARAVEINKILKDLDAIEKRLKGPKGEKEKKYKYKVDRQDKWRSGEMGNLQEWIQEQWEARIKQKGEFRDKMADILMDMESTTNVDEQEKLFLKFKDLEKAMLKADIYPDKLFPEGARAIRGITEHAYAIQDLAKSYTDAGTAVSMYKGLMGDFIGSDIQSGLDFIAQGAIKTADAIKNQGSEYEKLNAVIPAIQGFSNALIKDKKKLALVNMMFETAQAWQAWAEYRYPQAIAHSTAAITYGMIGGGILKLPSKGGSGSGNGSSKTKELPPINITVVGNIAQTEAERGVMLQHAINEARREGRI